MVKGSGGLPNELLYGRVGYLYSLVFINQQFGQDRIPLQYIQQVGRGKRGWATPWSGVAQKRSVLPVLQVTDRV